MTALWIAAMVAVLTVFAVLMVCLVVSARDRERQEDALLDAQWAARQAALRRATRSNDVR